MRGFFLLLVASSLALGALGCSSSPSSSTSSTDSSQTKGGLGDIVGPYQLPDPKWPQWAHPYPKAGYVWGLPGGVFAESPNRIYFANRGELKLPDKMPAILPALSYGSAPGIGGAEFPGFWGAFGYLAANEPIANMVNVIVVVDGNGKLLESWNQWDKLFELAAGHTASTSAPTIRSGASGWSTISGTPSSFSHMTASSSCKPSEFPANGAITRT